MLMSNEETSEINLLFEQLKGKLLGLERWSYNDMARFKMQSKRVNEIVEELASKSLVVIEE